ncbi:MAG: hypothetical protein CM15mP22_0840 [Gammaproteobacteria bacterium]|nr:MAG: hypothetical protein CM15mP22_0840 [Gammaproteobacteria bacterium]
MYGQMYEGIVYNAVLLTVTILLSLLLVYRSGLIEANENFKLGIFAATGGIALFYIISFVCRVFLEEVQQYLILQMDL